MPLSEATISYDLSDLTGVDFDARRTKVWASTNIPGDTVVDTDGNKIRLGSGSSTIAADGTGSIVVWIPGTGSNPASWQTYIHVDYPDRQAHGGRGKRTFGPFTITASVNLADLIDEQEVPPTYISALTVELDGYATDAANSAAVAQAAADSATAIVGIDTTDEAVAAGFQIPDSQSGAYVSDTIAAEVPPLAEAAAEAVVDPLVKAGTSDPRAGAVTSLWEIRQTLDAGLTDITVGLSGDSVSTDFTEWHGLFWTGLAALYPTHTFIWKGKVDSSDTYAADVTIQTGSGSRTVTIYNWAQNGAAHNNAGLESNARIAVAFPVTLDYLFIATGHNDDVETAVKFEEYRRKHRENIARALDYHPGCQVTMVLINPKAPANAGYAEGLMAHRGMVSVAGEMGLPVLDLARKWLDTPAYETMIADGIHPNATGSQFMADEALSQFENAKRALAPNRVQRRNESILVPLMGGLAMTGTPALTLQASYGNTYGVAFDPAATEMWLTPMVEIPPWWNKVMIDLLWGPQTNTAGNFRLRLGIVAANYNHLTVGSVPGVESQPLYTVPVPTTKLGNMFETVLTSAAPRVMSQTWRKTNKVDGPWAPFQFRVERMGSVADALDTYTGDVLIHGIRVRRFS